MPTANPELQKSLKKAKSKRMMFAYVAKGAEGTLLVARKVKPKEIADARKELGGGTVYKGQCFGEGTTMVFELAKEPPGALQQQIRKRMKDDAGLSMPVEVRVNEKAEEELPEEVEGAEPEAEEGDEAPPPPGTKPTEGPPAGQGLGAWQAARELVVKDLRAVAAQIAATKDPTAAAAIVELQSIIKQLTPAPTTPQQVAELDRYLRTDDVITAAEEIPSEMGTVRIREPLLKALESLK
jgi:hypothetical protein